MLAHGEILVSLATNIPPQKLTDGESLIVPYNRPYFQPIDVFRFFPALTRRAEGSIYKKFSIIFSFCR